MADSSWWDDLLQRMFGQGMDAYGTGGLGFEGAKALSGTVQTELQREEQAGAPQPTPTATAKPAQAPNPNARADEALAARLGQATGNVKPEDPLYGNLPDAMVYLGSERVMHGQNLTNIKKSIVKPIAEVTAQINEWSPKKLEKFAVLAVAAGYLKTPTNNVDELESIWQALAIRSAKMYSRGVKATPWELLERYGTDPLGNKKALGPVTTTSISKNVNLSSPRDANTLVDAALSDRLGRSATKAEKKAFLAALNKAEKKEPTTTKTTTTTTGSGTENVSSTSNTESSGGVNATSFAQEYALGHNKDEAGQYQALATYMPAFFQALGAPV